MLYGQQHVATPKTSSEHVAAPAGLVCVLARDGLADVG